MFRRPLFLLSGVLSAFSVICAHNDTNIDSKNNISYTSSNSTQHTAVDARDVINQLISRKCSDHYSITCLKVEFNTFIDKLMTTRNFQILPGISLINSLNSTANKTDMPPEVAFSLVGSNNTKLNSYLLQKINKYFDSLSVRVNLLENPLVQNLKDYSYKTFSEFFNPIEETGRSKKTGKQDMHAALWTAAMLAALGFSGLAALAGKAMLTGALALILSLICLLRGCGRGGHGSHYEIITKPAQILHDVDHFAGYSGSLANYGRRYINGLLSDADTSDEVKEYNRGVPVIPLVSEYNYGSQ